MGVVQVEVEEEAFRAGMRVAREMVGADDITGRHVHLVVAALWGAKDDAHTLDTSSRVLAVVRARRRSAVHAREVRVREVRSSGIRLDRSDGGKGCMRGVGVKKLELATTVIGGHEQLAAAQRFVVAKHERRLVVS
jgi:hypothetical protein